MNVRKTLSAALAVTFLATTAVAGEVGHYNPGVLNIRDLLVPEPGFYAALYNHYYTSGRLNDGDGDPIDSIHVPGPAGPGLHLDVDVELDIYAAVPTLIWVSDWRFLGARYGAYIAPTLANSSINAALSTQNGFARDADNDSFAFGDILVQPLWLGWSLPNLEAAFGYGFYAPTGKYDVDTVTLPHGAIIRAESDDNIGYGFWTHQLQAAGAWYPWTDKRTAVVLGTTYEIHHDKDGFDVTPGHDLTLNWGISQYLPLTQSRNVVAELGIAGYDSWQVTEDAGDDATSEVQDSVHAAGFQAGLIQVPWGVSVNFHYFYEFAADDRFQGHVLGLNLAKKF
ncbi:MAG TPA: transporter [Candidatus Binatia bacterium]|nr:transporter [Candidatus Binatia bacterium]